MMLIRFIYYNNFQLLYNIKNKFISDIFDILLKLIKIGDWEEDNYLNCHVLECVRSFIHQKSEIIFLNQIILIKKICMLEYNHMFVVSDIHSKEIQQNLMAFDNALKRQKDIIAIPPQVNYFTIFLLILTYCSKGIGNLSKNICQNYYPLK